MCVMNGKETKFTKQDNARRNLYQDLDRLLLDIQSGLYPVNGGAGVRGEVLNSEKMEKETEPRLITCPVSLTIFKFGNYVILCDLNVPKISHWVCACIPRAPFS